MHCSKIIAFLIPLFDLMRFSFCSIPPLACRKMASVAALAEQGVSEAIQLLIKAGSDGQADNG